MKLFDINKGRLLQEVCWILEIILLFDDDIYSHFFKTSILVQIIFVIQIFSFLFSWIINHIENRYVKKIRSIDVVNEEWRMKNTLLYKVHDKWIENIDIRTKKNNHILMIACFELIYWRIARRFINRRRTSSKFRMHAFV